MLTKKNIADRGDRQRPTNISHSGHRRLASNERQPNPPCEEQHNNCSSDEETLSFSQWGGLSRECAMHKAKTSTAIILKEYSGRNACQRESRRYPAKKKVPRRKSADPLGRWS